MLRLRTSMRMLSVGFMVLGAGMAAGQGFPNKPIRLVAAAAGGGSDFMARVIAQETTAGFGQPVVVENRTSLLVYDIVSRATPDGYTLAVVGNSFVIGPLLKKMFYDPVKDFAPVVLVTTSPNIVVVPAPMPVKSIGELIHLAKAKPGQLNYGSSDTGGSNHLAAELFKAMAGVDIVRVTYKGGGPAIAALVSGEVQLMFASTPSVAAHIKSGRLRSLAVTSAQPSALAPGLPTVAASGLPGYDSTGIDALFAPAKTPASVIRRTNDEVVRALRRPEVKQRFLDSGVEVVASSPEELGARVKSDTVRWGKIIQDAGLREN